MPHPKEGYRTKDGARVPGTTTIIGRFKESGALLKWAWQQGRDGKDLYETRDTAANIGTAAHSMVEARIRGNDPEQALTDSGLADEHKERARGAFGAYETWASMSKLEIIEQEMTLVSEKYRFGGTPDAIGLVNGKLCLVDWKTSNGVYSDYLLQLAAYRQLWEETHPDRPLQGGFHLCRFAKEYGDFSHHYFPELADAWTMFSHLRSAYEFDKVLRKRAA
jgi:hypothetical protein